MKKHLYFLAALLLSACQVAEENIDNAPICHEGIVFTAGFEEPDTKVYVDEGLHTRWNTGDEISIFTSTANQEFTFDGVTGDREGNFNPANPGQFHSGSPIPTIYAVYPYSKGTSVSQNGTITLTLPEIQHYAENTYGPGSNTMVAVTPNSYSNILCFKNLCGFIVVKLYGDAVVKTITLTGNNGEKISGQATVSPIYGQAPTVTMSPSAGTSITLDCGDGVELGRTPEEATAFWFVVPPVSFSKGFTIRVEDATGAWAMEQITSLSRTVCRKVVNTFPPLRTVLTILNDGNISFSDEGFRTYCIDNLDMDEDGEVSFKEADSVTEIHLCTDEISSLDDIRYFRNLITLECTGSDWNEDDDYHSGTGRLSHLDISHNSQLRVLKCNNNHIASLDIRFNPELKEIDCSHNPIKQLDITRNPKLRTVHCVSNYLTELDLSQNTQLYDLNCSHNGLLSLDVSRNAWLTYLDCSSNQITTLDVSHISLRLLLCNLNRLTTLVLGRRIDLTQGLTSLDCSDNQLSSLDVSHNINLIQLNCSDNQLSSLDVSHNISLKQLACSNNQLSSLDVSHNIELSSLSCGYNYLTSLNISQNPDITELDCVSNWLTLLDVSLNPNLTYLVCNNNQLNKLDISYCPALSFLSCTGNKNLADIILLQGQSVSSLVYDHIISTIRFRDPNIICFNDEEIKRFCLYNFDLDKDGEISFQEAEKVWAIMDSSGRVHTLSDIKWFKNLIYLDCSVVNGALGQLTTLDVSHNPALQKLICSNNQITELDLSHNPALTILKCDHNQLSTLNISNNPLVELDCTDNPSLTEIWLNKDQTISQFYFDNQIATIKYDYPITFTDDNFKAFCVQEFDLNGDGEVSFTEAQAVTRIEVATNGISSLGGIEEFKNLTTLVCKTANNYYGNLTSLDVSQNTKLTRLNCYANRISSLDLSHNTELTSLDCSYNQLSSLDLRHNTKLDSLDCRYNQLVSLDVSHNPAMNTLRCSKNRLESLSLSNEALHSLICTSNKLTVLDVSLCPSLEHLDCCDNYIQSLDLSNNTHLIDLLCYNNELSLLDVSHCLELEGIRCQSNHLTTLDVRHNEKTTAIVCFGNQMTDLYLGSNPYLYYLNCSQNAIKSLDVSHFPALRTFNCSTNRLTTLDVSNNPVLDNLSCEENPDLTEIWLKYGQAIRLFSYDTGIATIKYKD